MPQSTHTAVLVENPDPFDVDHRPPPSKSQFAIASLLDTSHRPGQTEPGDINSSRFAFTATGTLWTVNEVTTTTITHREKLIGDLRGDRADRKPEWHPSGHTVQVGTGLQLVLDNDQPAICIRETHMAFRMAQSTSSCKTIYSSAFILRDSQPGIASNTQRSMPNVQHSHFRFK